MIKHIKDINTSDLIYSFYQYGNYFAVDIHKRGLDDDESCIKGLTGFNSLNDAIAGAEKYVLEALC